MTATYDPEHTEKRDVVRLEVGDAIPATAQLQDEELDALLAVESNVWLACARALEILQTRWSAAGEGVLEKQVDNLKIKRGMDGTASQVLQARIDYLRAKGNRQASPTPHVFRVM